MHGAAAVRSAPIILGDLWCGLAPRRKAFSLDGDFDPRTRTACERRRDLSCIGSTRAFAPSSTAKGRGSSMVALRGDLPSGMAVAGEFRFASDLIGLHPRGNGRSTHTSKRRRIRSTTRKHATHRKT